MQTGERINIVRLTSAAINNIITPYGFDLYQDKAIPAQYPSISSIPETRYYEEYSIEAI